MNQIALRLAKVLSRSKNRFVYSVSQKLVTMPFSKQLFSTAGGSKYTFDEEKAKSVSVIPESKQSHKSNAQDLINKIPVIQVDQNTVRCKGVNELAFGHPVVYIQVMGKFPHQPATCKWCGLRYIKRGYLEKEK